MAVKKTIVTSVESIRSRRIVKKLRRCNPYLQTLVGFAAVIVAACAVWVSNRAMQMTDQQFRRNSQMSDSLFNVQLQYSKALNDSLIFQISKLQETTSKQLSMSDSLFNVQLHYSKALNDSLIFQISKLHETTSKQLAITDEQLKISSETLREQLYSGRPKIVVVEITISDTGVVIDGMFSPIIRTQYGNQGARHADSLEFRPFIVFKDLSGFRAGIIPHESAFLEPGASRKSEFKPRIAMESRDDFFYCFEILYYDAILDKKSSQAYYWHYYKSRGTFQFLSCSDETKRQINEVINQRLRSLKERLFDQQ
jgi:hypothetical protein